MGIVPLIGCFSMDITHIIILTLYISTATLILSVVIGFCLAGVLVQIDFKLKSAIVALMHILMGIPSVVVGLLFFLLFARSGFLGFLDVLYKPTGIIIAQTSLVLPMVVSFGYDILEKKKNELQLFVYILPLTKTQKCFTYMYEARFLLVTVILATYGRAISEIGAVTIVGGNIEHVSRVLTTAIVLETQKGYINQALILGGVLMLIVCIINIISIFLMRFIHAR